MKTAFKYGLFIGLGLIAYFMLMKIFGLEDNFVLRLFNFVILIVGVYFLLKNQVVDASEPVSYFEGLGLSLRATITSIAVFLIFLAVYVLGFNTGFIEVLQESQIWGTKITLPQAAIGIFIEGMASAVIISFIWMQYFKKYTSSKGSSLKQ